MKYAALVVGPKYLNRIYQMEHQRWMVMWMWSCSFILQFYLTMSQNQTYYSFNTFALLVGWDSKFKNVFVPYNLAKYN